MCVSSLFSTYCVNGNYAMTITYTNDICVTYTYQYESVLHRVMLYSKQICGQSTHKSINSPIYCVTPSSVMIKTICRHNTT